MADFFDGQNIVESYHTPGGLAAGWAPINGKLAVKTPKVDQKYWKLDGKAIIEMDKEEKDAVDNPPPPVISGVMAFNKMLDELEPAEQDEIILKIKSLMD